MQHISEAESRLLITHEMAFEAVKDAFLAAALDTRSTVFPAVIAHGTKPTNVFTIKSRTTSTVSGLKVGSYWPGNSSNGIPNHNSTILLIDETCGKIASVIGAGEVNAYRTAAADAVAASLLARPDSSTLAIFGAGHQALFKCLALARVLPIKKIIFVARDPVKAQCFVQELERHALDAIVATSAEAACKEADVVVTATPSRAPLFEHH